MGSSGWLANRPGGGGAPSIPHCMAVFFLLWGQNPSVARSREMGWKMWLVGSGASVGEGRREVLVVRPCSVRPT